MKHVNKRSRFFCCIKLLLPAITVSYMIYYSQHGTGPRSYHERIIAYPVYRNIHQILNKLRFSIGCPIFTELNMVFFTGPITAGNVVSILPWGGKVVVKELRGSVLLDVLENAVHRYEQVFKGHVGEFLQVSGSSYKSLVRPIALDSHTSV